MSTAHYHVDLFDGVVTIRWTVKFNGDEVGTGTEATPEMALEAAQHCIDQHAADIGIVFELAA